MPAEQAQNERRMSAEGAQRLAGGAGRPPPLAGEDHQKQPQNLALSSSQQSNLINHLSHKVEQPKKAQNFSSAGDQTSYQDSQERSMVSSQFRHSNAEKQLPPAGMQALEGAGQDAVVLSGAGKTMQAVGASHMSDGQLAQQRSGSKAPIPS